MEGLGFGFARLTRLFFPMAVMKSVGLLRPYVVLQLLLSISYAQNLTLTFSPASADTCSSPGNASSVGGITFTTSSTPCTAQCVNLADIYGGESTGIVKDNRGITCVDDELYNITYTISNQDAFDASKNYSQIFYQQTLAAQPFIAGQEIAENQAWRSVNFYSDPDCYEGIDEDAPKTKRVEPYYVHDCVSPDQGQCNTATVGVKSFLIANVVNAYEDPREGTCRDFAVNGDGARVGVRTFGIVAGCVLAMLGAVF